MLSTHCLQRNNLLQAWKNIGNSVRSIPMGYRRVFYPQSQDFVLFLIITEETECDKDPTLFSYLRATIQTITESLLAKDEIQGLEDSTALNAFKVRHSVGAYLCQNPNCSSSEQGFSTPELRRMHEDSHAPRFRCDQADCAKRNWPFKTRAQLEKHSRSHNATQDLSRLPETLKGSFGAEMRIFPKIITNEMTKREAVEFQVHKLHQQSNTTIQVDLMHEFSTQLEMLCISEDCNLIAGFKGETTYVYLICNQKLLSSFRNPSRGPGIGTNSSMCFGHENKELITSSNEHLLYLWDLEKREISMTLNPGFKSLSVAFCTANRLVASSSSGGTVCIWESTSGTQIYKSEPCMAYSISFSRSGNLLVGRSVMGICTTEFSPYFRIDERVFPDAYRKELLWSKPFSFFAQDHLCIGRIGARTGRVDALDIWRIPGLVQGDLSSSKAMEHVRTIETSGGFGRFDITPESRWVLCRGYSSIGGNHHYICFVAPITWEFHTYIRFPKEDIDDIVASTEKGIFATLGDNGDVRIWR